MLERIVDETGVEQDGGVFRLDTSLEGLPEAVFRFGQALTRIYDLTFLSRSRVKSTFYDDLTEVLKNLVGENKIQADYVPRELPNPEPCSCPVSVPTSRCPTGWRSGSRPICRS